MCVRFVFGPQKHKIFSLYGQQGTHNCVPQLKCWFCVQKTGVPNILSDQCTFTSKNFKAPQYLKMIKLEASKTFYNSLSCQARSCSTLSPAQVINSAMAAFILETMAQHGEPSEVRNFFEDQNKKQLARVDTSLSALQVL